MKKYLLCDISCILLALAITLFGGYWYLDDKLIKQTEHKRVIEVIKQAPQAAPVLKESSVNKVKREYSYTAMSADLPDRSQPFETAVKYTE